MKPMVMSEQKLTMKSCINKRKQDNISTLIKTEVRDKLLEIRYEEVRNFLEYDNANPFIPKYKLNERLKHSNNWEISANILASIYSQWKGQGACNFRHV